jgi:type IV secretory pathway VirB3-like protein
MQVSSGEIKHVLAGKEVLGVLAEVLVVSGMTTASVFVHVGELVASHLTLVVPAVSGHAAVVVVASLYLQAVVLAAVYRTCRSVYETLERRRRRVKSA